MKKFLLHILLFLVCFTLFLTAYVKGVIFIQEQFTGPDTAHQIHQSFSNAVSQEYSCYFLGNSRIYRGINPSCFSGISSYNFAHDNDTYNQMYYKLLYLEKNQMPDYLVIGTDYFQFSFLEKSRNYVYTPLLGSEYQRDYINGSYNIVSVLREAVTDFKYFWNGKRPSVKLIDTIDIILNKESNGTSPRYQKENGQYILEGKSSPDDTVTRDNKILDIQWEYFLKIIENCQRNGIELFVVMPPTRDAELESYTPKQMREFDAKIEEALGRDGHYLNCCDLPEFKDYTNYTDITHLTPRAADQFSTYLNSQLPFSN